MRDLVSNIGAVQALAPAVQAATINGTSIDTQGYNRLGFIITTGAIVAAGDFGAKLQDSDDNATFADVPAAKVKGVVPTTLLTGATYKLGYIGERRYVRLVATKAGGTSVAIGAVAILGDPAHSPVA